MNRRINRIVVLLMSLFFLQACTNALYKSEIDALDSSNQARKVILYWTKTEKLIGDDKAGPAILLTECSSRRLTFVEKESGIYFFGTPGMDRQADGRLVSGQDVKCGELLEQQTFVNIKPGPLRLKIYCQAVFDDFSAIKSPYLKSRNEPYVFDIKETSQWSFLGETPDTPVSPKCRQQ